MISCLAPNYLPSKRAKFIPRSIYQKLAIENELFSNLKIWFLHRISFYSHRRRV